MEPAKKIPVSQNYFMKTGLLKGMPMKIEDIFRGGSLKRPVSGNMPGSKMPVTYVYVYVVS